MENEVGHKVRIPERRYLFLSGLLVINWLDSGLFEYEYFEIGSPQPKEGVAVWDSDLLSLLLYTTIYIHIYHVYMYIHNCMCFSIRNMLSICV